MHPQLVNATKAAAWGSTWVERNQSVAPELGEKCADLTVALERSANLLNYSATNVAARPTIGLFGASQAGKSYLVSTLAAGSSGTLSTHWDGAAVDFIRHVNPSGNNSEATGFATRFTHRQGTAPQGFPIELKVLHELELAMILINAFFYDINQSDVKVPTSEDAYLIKLAALEPLVDTAARAAFMRYDPAQAQELSGGAGAPVVCSAGRTVTVGGVTETNYLSPQQVVELADYVAQNSNGKLGSFEEMPRLWQQLRHMLPFMTLEGRIKALSIFWQDLPIFSETYRVLATELLRLQGHQWLYAPQEAFVTTNPDGSLVQNAAGTIMHITKLSTMFSDKTSLNCALVDAGTVTPVTVNASRLAALSLELSFFLESSGELDRFDVLDLPGARSRDVVLLQDVKDDGAAFTPGMAGAALPENFQMRGSEFYRRGKVAYLFERYARRNEIDQLLFCIGVNAQQDVTSVLTILSDWVERNVGKTPERRANVYNPLTIILTRYDEVFNRQLRNLSSGLPLDMNQELNIALNRIQKLNWFNEWTPGKPFNRVLLARKPNLGDLNPWLECDANLRELGIKESAAQGIEQIKAALCAVPEFNQHIADLPDALNALLTLNDGGVSALATLIQQGAQSDAVRLSARTKKAVFEVHKCVADLSPFATRDGAQRLEENQHKSKELALGLLQCNVLAPCFDLLRRLVEIDESRLEEIYQQGFSSGSNVARFVTEVCAEYEERLNALQGKDHVALNQIADLVCVSFERLRKNIEADPKSVVGFSLCYNISEQRFKTPEELKDDVVTLFNRIFAEIATAFRSPQVGLKAHMMRVLLERENTTEGFGDIVRLQVELMAQILSEFNLYLGANLLPNSATQAALAQAKAEAAAQLTTSGAQLKAAAAPMPAAPSAAATPFSALGGEDDLDDFSDLAGLDDENDYGAPVSAPVSAPAAPASAPAARAPSSAPSMMSAALAAAPLGVSAEILSAGAGRELMPGESVLGTKEGPINCFSKQSGYVSYDPKHSDSAVFSRSCTLDETGLLPHLDATSAGYEFKFLSDFAATLGYMMCQVNVAVQSKYHFSSDENFLLCAILSALEELK